MQQKECARVNIEHLAFNRVIDEPPLITIPIKGKRDVVICATTRFEKALLRFKVSRGWDYSPIDEETTKMIYKKLREAT